MNRFGNRRRGASASTARSKPAPREEELATFAIDSIAAGGDGVGRLDGMACFVPRAAPGDVAQVAYINHGRYARGRILQLLSPSADRVEPRCAHYTADACGGCQLQHLSESAQQQARRAMVRDALARVARRDMPLPELVTGESWAYRERLSLTVRARGQQVIGGLIPVVHPALPFSLDRCEIAHPQLNSCWQAIRGALRGMPVSSGENVVRVSLRLADAAATRVAVVVSGAREWTDHVAWGVRVLRASALVSAVWWETADGRRVHLAGDDDASVLAFAQVNRQVALALREHVLTAIRALQPTSVVDAYAGRGDVSATLAAAGCRVIAIESDRAATADASIRLAPYASARVVTALVEAALPDALPADVVLLNPPRRGVDVRVCATLADAAEQGTRAIIYVSCDPATLARDLSRLPRWRIASLRCFDMFPQTAHVETVCVLVPDSSDSDSHPGAVLHASRTDLEGA